MARNSFSVMEYFFSASESFFDDQSMTLSSPSSSCCKQASTPVLDASVVKTNGLVKSGILTAILELILSLNFENALSNSSFQLSCSLSDKPFKLSYSGPPIVARCGIYFL
ncbi:hypothetical protein NGRA_2034 [Nosema granulosis]|uniref:Uncharacterized protein n=1 Tax=Nosema granulosis TaxID=83296 RepID=A0A9P6GYW8_9MICR|nr:hypothetical protein NGRA_2034 [Nosema granulosis]